MNEGYVNFILL